MADVLRSVNTKFWQDPYIEDLKSTEKLLFLYLITNPSTNILGIYEISIKLIAFHMGINRDDIINILDKFKNDEKIYFHQNYMILPNFSKNQKLNKNMFIGAVKLFEKLPIDIKNFIIQKELEGFKRILKAFKGLKQPSKQSEVEIEKENEKEDESEKEEITQTIYLEFNHLSITNENHKNLTDKYGSEKVENIYKRIKNYSENKKYNDLYLTSVFWLEEDSKNKNGYKKYSFEQMSEMAIKDKKIMETHKPVKFKNEVKWVSLENIKKHNLKIKDEKS